MLCGDESRRFLVFAAADLREDAIVVSSALLLLEDVDFYRDRSRSLRDLLGGELRDLLVRPDGSVEARRVRAGLAGLEPEPSYPRGRPWNARPPLSSLRGRAWSRRSLSVRNWQQLGKFCAVGAVGYVINLAVYDVLRHAGLHYLVAATCSFLVAVTSNYTWNRLWTFREHRGHVGIQGMRFFLVSLAALGANLARALPPGRLRRARQASGAGHRDRARDAAQLRREQALVVPRPSGS